MMRSDRSFELLVLALFALVVLGVWMAFMLQ